MKIKKKPAQNTTSFTMQSPICWSSSSITNQHPMGVNCASLNVDFVLHSYESGYIQTLNKDKIKQQQLQPLIFSVGILYRDMPKVFGHCNFHSRTMHTIYKYLYLFSELFPAQKCL